MLAKTIVRITVLHDTDDVDINDMSLEAICHEATFGNFCQNYEIVSTDELSKEEMAEELVNMGSEPGFLIPDYDEEEN